MVFLVRDLGMGPLFKAKGLGPRQRHAGIYATLRGYALRYEGLLFFRFS
jgi:hypothetical protein